MNAQPLNGVTMAHPHDGFVNRVMARVDAYERARARRRAWIGAGVYAVYALALVAAPFALFGSELTVSTFAAFIASFATALPLDLSVLVGALATTLGAILSGLNGVWLLVYAVGAFALTLMWLGVLVAPLKMRS
jgi:vacuolar-type H+-ATPase subunit I/STV1